MPSLASSATGAASPAFVVQLRANRMKTTKCPVCNWDIKDGGIKVKVGGKEITVCCEDCATKAKEKPAQYAGTAK
jgi:hypothetical protein